MSNWYGSLNIDGIKECGASGTKEAVIREMFHYMMMLGGEIEGATKRVTMTIQKGKSDE